ncbi:GNAT family N-acetyltransferase [Pseudidiomarina andamanensis]|uniref:GNAT family N-acetyltransferase n=1 Tax=Pseudidiomarina andamanensis TaxID=1940690 RepID=A0AA92ES56_9GAMM|nr:GNAT family N-acetyltransferase [Pseudidiomarina andamanensis]MDS0218082.1 GNAT family N-acetyltransferase [Pseudidiomarina andamanensis]QGT94968.1 GNAT family N-acetyltransferase [Pseudidiomarina andamanensis]
MYQLILPTAKLKASYDAYIAELGSEERYPFPLDFEHRDFEAMLDRIEGIRNGTRVPDGFVQSSTFWMVADDEIIGCTNIRHRLNAQIEYCGGHIGLSVRPSFRRQGLGIKLLQLSLEQARELGIQTAHIHCHKHNVASRAMIEACGGVFHSEINDNGSLVSRYLIELT